MGIEKCLSTLLALLMFVLKSRRPCLTLDCLLCLPYVPISVFLGTTLHAGLSSFVLTD